MALRWYVASGELPRKEKTDRPLKVTRIIGTRGNRGHADVSKKLGKDFPGVSNVWTTRFTEETAKEFDIPYILKNWTVVTNLVDTAQQEQQ